MFTAVFGRWIAGSSEWCGSACRAERSAGAYSACVAKRVEVQIGGESREVSADVAHFLDHARALNTTRAYASDWRDFVYWCAQNNVESLPASGETVAEYIAQLAASSGAKTTTVKRRVSAINNYHDAQGAARPGHELVVREVLRGITRERRDDTAQAAPIRRAALVRVIEALQGASIQIARDRLLLSLGFYAALRRSELVGLEVEHVEVHRDGLTVFLPFSKTDQSGEGALIAVRGTNDASDPVAAVAQWKALSGVVTGPLLRGVTVRHQVRKTPMSPGSVNAIVKAAVARVGEDPALYSGHSMRAGFVTSAREAGVPDHMIMHTTRHKDVRMLSVYSRVGEAFDAAVSW